MQVMQVGITGEFLSDRRAHLMARRTEKTEILAARGEQAKVHSPNDIVRIDFALKRMNEGQYGLCTNCGCQIDRDRLRVIPETPFCAPCASDMEAS
jgi:RNA polymerase-binding transcription factor DksA